MVIDEPGELSHARAEAGVCQFDRALIDVVPASACEDVEISCARGEPPGGTGHASRWARSDSLRRLLTSGVRSSSNSRCRRCCTTSVMFAYETGLLEEAASAFGRAVRLKPRLAGAHHNLAICSGSARARPDAVRADEATVKLEPRRQGSAVPTRATLPATFPLGDAEAALRAAAASNAIPQ